MNIFWNSCEGEPRFCTCCDVQIDNGYGGDGVEVEGYTECLDCLTDDPEIAAELKETHPDLFTS